MRRTTRIGVLSALAAVSMFSMPVIASEGNNQVLQVLIEGVEEPVKVVNQSEIDMKSVAVENAEEGHINIIFASADGTQYEFENVDYADMIEPAFVEEGVFAFIKYTGAASGKERSYGQTGELEYKEPAELFAIDDVYIRQEPDSESDIVGLIYRGDAISVLGETAKYYIVQKEDVTGYTVKRCISEDEQDAIAAVKAQEAALAAQEAAAAAYYAPTEQWSGYAGVSEVSRQRFDDCDGSGHGYYVIHYSDGSQSIQNY
ncbi:MAG: SH3 domain-containing protein [Blautia sp.]|nr:SH3 domain-containing protein [Blautia sp.]